MGRSLAASFVAPFSRLALLVATLALATPRISAADGDTLAVDPPFAYPESAVPSLPQSGADGIWYPVPMVTPAVPAPGLAQFLAGPRHP